MAPLKFIFSECYICYFVKLVVNVACYILTFWMTSLFKPGLRNWLVLGVLTCTVVFSPVVFIQLVLPDPCTIFRLLCCQHPSPRRTAVHFHPEGTLLPYICLWPTLKLHNLIYRCSK